MIVAMSGGGRWTNINRNGDFNRPFSLRSQGRAHPQKVVSQLTSILISISEQQHFFGFHIFLASPVSIQPEYAGAMCNISISTPTPSPGFDKLQLGVPLLNRRILETAIAEPASSSRPPRLSGDGRRGISGGRQSIRFHLSSRRLSAAC